MSAPDIKNELILPKIAGLKSIQPPHTVAWEINRCFGMNFKLSKDWHKVYKDKSFSFIHFFCRFEDVELNWHLIFNRGEQSWFFKSKPIFDYILVCNGDDIYGYFERALDAIRNSSKNIQAFKFSFQQVPDKDAYFSNFIISKQFIEDFHV